MTGIPEDLAALVAAATAAVSATAPADAAAAAGATAAGGAAATGAAASGISTATALSAAGAAAGVAGTAAQLLAKQPKTPNLTPPQRDQAQLEADQRNNLLKSRGRAAALLTPGGGSGISTSSASLGASQLLGSG